MQKFCHHCGKQSLAGAKFCSSCGTNLTSLSATPASSAQSAADTFTPFVPGVGEDGEGPLAIDGIGFLAKIRNIRNQLSSLDIGIAKDRPQGETFGQMAVMAEADARMNGGVLPKPQDGFQRPAPYANVDQKAFLAEFKSDSAPAKRGQDAYEIK